MVSQYVGSLRQEADSHAAIAIDVTASGILEPKIWQNVRFILVRDYSEHQHSSCSSKCRHRRMKAPMWHLHLKEKGVEYCLAKRSESL